MTSLQIQSEYTSTTTNDNTSQGNGDECDERTQGSEGRRSLCLSFEFLWQASVATLSDNKRSGAAGPFAQEDAPLLRALHHIPVASVPHVSAAVARRHLASEI
jgi:hypothetical protein